MPLMPPTIKTATILNGTSLSAGVEIGEGVLVEIDVPTFTSAVLTFQVSSDGGTTYRDAYDAAAAEITLGAATTGNRAVAAPATLNGAWWLKVRSGTSAAPVNQGADRTITLVVK